MNLSGVSQAVSEVLEDGWEASWSRTLAARESALARLRLCSPGLLWESIRLLITLGALERDGRVVESYHRVIVCLTDMLASMTLSEWRRLTSPRR